jgi:urease accessory protein UreF
LKSLRCFLRDYQSNILFRWNGPHFAGRAYAVVMKSGTDRTGPATGHEPLLHSFATASQRVGKTQLKRLRPLRDQRLVQRYVHAVQTGEAHAWHTVVYGLILSLYSLPLRPCLLSYAQQTTLGFIRSAAGPLRLTGAVCEDLMSDEGSGFPEAVNRLLLPAVGPRPMGG